MYDLIIVRQIVFLHHLPHNILTNSRQITQPQQVGLTVIADGALALASAELAA
jgi:hypothetical protein